MPRFHYMSDLHLEFAALTSLDFKGENLILAGDITLLNCLDPSKTDADNRSLRKQTLAFFEYVSASFDKVFYLTGNHESYRSDISREREIIQKYLGHFPNLYHLDDSRFDIDESTVLLGGTLWTDMNRGNPSDMMIIRGGLNDYRLIKNGKNIFTPEDSLAKHAATMDFFSKQLAELADKKVVIATHHSPSVLGLSHRHHGSNLNAGYYSNLENFILDNPQIKCWVFGHTHLRLDTEIGDCRLLSNARGYHNYEPMAKTFNPDTWFEL